MARGRPARKPPGVSPGGVFPAASTTAARDGPRLAGGTPALPRMDDRRSFVGGAVKLGIEDFLYADLYDFARLGDLARSFDRFLGQQDAALFGRLDAYRDAVQGGIARGGLTPPEESEVLIAVSRHLGVFLAQLFQTDATPLTVRAHRDEQVARFKKELVAKRVAKVQALREDADTLGDA